MINILFAGRKQIAAATLDKLAQTKGVNISAVLTDSHLDGSPTTKVARKHDLPIYSFDEALRKIKIDDLKVDLGLSVLYWRKFKEEFITKPSRGIINFHPAPLPEYKGTAGYNLAILEERDSWGVSAHYVDSEIDTGDIIKVLEFNIDPDKELCNTLEKKSMEYMATLIDEVIFAALESSEKLPTTPNVGGRYISRQQMEELKNIQPDDDVARKARAFWFPPYSGASIEINGRKFTVIDDEILKTLTPPGTTSLFTEKL